MVARIKWLNAEILPDAQNHRTINARSRFTHGKCLEEESESGQHATLRGATGQATIKNNILYNPNNEKQGANTETRQNLAPKKSGKTKTKIR